jgi:predicted nuclease of predicted toxin-antitoxin system
VKFYLDEDLPPAIATGLRRRGVDAVSAHEVGHVGVGDAEQLTFTVDQGRCLVTGNAGDFRRLACDAIERGRPHAGIVLCPPRIHTLDVGAVVKALMKIAERYPAGVGEYDVLYL